jgi:hypothetical protein
MTLFDDCLHDGIFEVTVDLPVETNNPTKDAELINVLEGKTKPSPGSISPDISGRVAIVIRLLRVRLLQIGEAATGVASITPRLRAVTSDLLSMRVLHLRWLST